MSLPTVNALADTARASAAAWSRDCNAEALRAGIGDLACVPGRFERVDCGQPFTVVVDYAHTDDALRNLTSLAREFVKPANGRVITVFGCGGDRDRNKRPLMGEAAGKGSDFVVLTSDNPRSEDPLAIINDAVVGLQRSIYQPESSAPPNSKERMRRGASKRSCSNCVHVKCCSPQRLRCSNSAQLRPRATKRAPYPAAFPTGPPYRPPR